LLLNRCGRGFAILILLAFSMAYLFDNESILLAGGFLLTGLLCKYLLFDRQFRKIIGSVYLNRSPERTTMRKGSVTGITTTVSLHVLPGMQVKLQEIIPLHATVMDGITVIDAGPGQPDSSYCFDYRIIPVVHGELHFPGIMITMRDLFFEDEIALTSNPFSGPSLHIQPVGFFESATARPDATETREIEKLSVVHGFGIRAIREYLPGDDLRNVDWKMSAKYGRYFVREYSSIVNLPPAIVVDLPWTGASFPAKDFARMVSAVAGMAEQAIRTTHSVSIVLISGPNILHVVREEKDVQRCMSTLRQWMHPAERVTYLYRTPDRSALRSRVRYLDNAGESGSGPVQQFYSNLKGHYLAALQYQKPFAFSLQFGRVLSVLPVDELYLFSVGNGDLTYISQLVREAKAEKLDVHIRVPDAMAFTRHPEFRHRLAADSVEAFS
jgi:uncharacterized protein (DUF58 family)